MAFTIDIKHLESDGKNYEGEIPEEELDLGLHDELLHPAGPLQYRLWIEKHEENLLLQGELSQIYRCECARCLKSFEYEATICDWHGFVALEGEESLPINNDTVDLTAVLREDILLVLPQHPVCGQDCQGMVSQVDSAAVSDDEVEATGSSPWAALDDLKLENDKD
ncbi:MAG: DUF177 domain-containing protein [Verrucomicrobiota bacterium]|jgi:uncharacterized protein